MGSGRFAGKRTAFFEPLLANYVHGSRGLCDRLGPRGVVPRRGALLLMTWLLEFHSIFHNSGAIRDLFTEPVRLSRGFRPPRTRFFMAGRFSRELATLVTVL